MPEAETEAQEEYGIAVELVWALAHACGVEEPWKLVRMEIHRGEKAEFVVAGEAPKIAGQKLSPELLIGFLASLGITELWRFRRVYCDHKTLTVEMYVLGDDGLPETADGQIVVESYEAPLVLSELTEAIAEANESDRLHNTRT